MLGTDHMAEALAQTLDAPPPPEALSAARDALAVARYASRPLALQVVRLACQASAGVAAAAHALGACLFSEDSTVHIGDDVLKCGIERVPHDAHAIACVIFHLRNEKLIRH